MVMQFFRGIFRPLALEARHHPSEASWVSGDYQMAFADYVANTRDMLRRAHAGKDAISLERIVDGNAPFELKPPEGYPAGSAKTYKRGVLLTHGLSDSPYFMRHLGAFFQENGFFVMAVLLPGHGKHPGDLLEVSWQEWSGTVAYGVDRLSEEVDEVYLAGFSAGGTLSVYQSLCDKRVRGLFLFSPALRVAARAALARFHKLYSWLIPTGKWLELKPDNDIYKYESFPKNAAAQMHALIMEVHKLLSQHQMDIPVFAVASADDTTVDISATLQFISDIRHPSSKLVLYAAGTPRAVPDNLMRAGKLELVNSVFPDQKILSFSHLAIVLPAEDKHYGAAGDYSNCIHYYPDDIEKYSACINNPQEDFQGELTEKNLNAGILRRLMYNPKFSELKISMLRFIDGLP